MASSGISNLLARAVVSESLTDLKASLGWGTGGGGRGGSTPAEGELPDFDRLSLRNVAADNVGVKLGRELEQQPVHEAQAAQELLPAAGFRLVSKNAT